MLAWIRKFVRKPAVTGHQEQIADLEERIEFAERLLTKQREQIGPG